MVEYVKSQTCNRVLDEGMVEQIWPTESLVWVFDKKTLQEVLEYSRHCFRPFNWIFDDQTTRRVY